LLAWVFERLDLLTQRKSPAEETAATPATPAAMVPLVA